MENKQNYGSRFLYAEDLLHEGEYRTAQVVISSIYEANTVVAANNKKVDKEVIEFDFRGELKMLAVCKSNYSMIITVTGEQFGAGWIGKAIKVQPRIVNAFGEETLAIRVVPPPGTVIRRKQKEMLGRKAIFKKGNE